jgi:hypothetical protein
MGANDTTITYETKHGVKPAGFLIISTTHQADIKSDATSILSTDESMSGGGGKCPVTNFGKTPDESDTSNVFGFYDGCPNGDSHGFTLYVLGDANTVYHINYEVYTPLPATAKEQNDELQGIVKFIHVCDKDNKCINLQNF